MKKFIISFLIVLAFANLYAIMLPEGTDARISEVHTFESGKIEAVRLAVPTEINTPIGKVESCGEVIFTASGKVQRFTPNKNGIYHSTVGDLTYRSGTSISFYKSGVPKSIVLYSSTKITLPCGEVNVSSSYPIDFYSTGEIKDFYLNNNSKITVSAGDFYARDYLELSKTGYPLSAKTPYSYNSNEINGLETSVGKIYPAENSSITFYSTGELKSVYPSEITVVKFGKKDFYALAKYEIGFSKKGSVLKATVTGNKVNVYGWNLKLEGENFTYMIYPKNRIGIIGEYESVNGKPGYDYGYQRFRVFEKDNRCYFYNSSQNKINKINLEGGVEFEKNVGGITLNASDFLKCPFLFDDEGNLIGYIPELGSYIGIDPVTDDYKYSDKDTKILF